MHLKGRAVAFVVAVLLSALVGPWGTARAAGGGMTRPTKAIHDAAHDEENAGNSAGDPDEAGDPGEAVSDSGENTDEPTHHDDSGDDGGDSNGSGTCAIAAGPVAVCLDQPR